LKSRHQKQQINSSFAPELLIYTCGSVAQLFYRRIHVLALGFRYGKTARSGRIRRRMGTEGIRTLELICDSKKLPYLLISLVQLDAMPLESQRAEKLPLLLFPMVHR
jgi:hypothetical protein